jgi:hypothetical protein
VWCWFACDDGGVAVGTPRLIVPEAVAFAEDVPGAVATFEVANDGAADAWVVPSLRGAGFDLPLDPFGVDAGAQRVLVVTRTSGAATDDAAVVLDASYDVFEVRIELP